MIMRVNEGVKVSGDMKRVWKVGSLCLDMKE